MVLIFANLGSEITCFLILFLKPRFWLEIVFVKNSYPLKSLKLLQSDSPNSAFRISGYEEDYFLQSLNVTFDDLEPLADGCSQVAALQFDQSKVKFTNIVHNNMDPDFWQKTAFL